MANYTKKKLIITMGSLGIACLFLYIAVLLRVSRNHHMYFLHVSQINETTRTERTNRENNWMEQKYRIIQDSGKNERSGTGNVQFGTSEFKSGDMEDWSSNMEIVIRTTCGKRYRKEYNMWFVKGFKLFWYFNNTKVKIVLDAEHKNNIDCIKDFSMRPPYGDIAFREPAKDPSIYVNSGRQRMIWDYMYPESYTRAKYVAFMDTDSMFVTTVTPESLFKDNTKPVVNARIGLDRPGSCWSASTLFFLGTKEIMDCMSYFPMLYKTQHVIETRRYIEQHHNKTFDLVWKEVYQHCGDPCQYNAICNYIWHHHKDEYDWHFNTIGSTLPNTGVWNGQGIKPWQVSAQFVKQLHESYKIPKHRVAIHVRHFIDTVTMKYGLMRNTFIEPTVSQLKYQLRHGLCLSFGFRYCANRCKDISPDLLQTGMFSFEEHDWFYDKRCITEQKEHYMQVEKFHIKHGLKLNCSLFELI